MHEIASSGGEYYIGYIERMCLTREFRQRNPTMICVLKWCAHFTIILFRVQFTLCAFYI